ncbi:MAG: ACT domain protein [Candidatus Methanomethylophilaceae archaeon]
MKNWEFSKVKGTNIVIDDRLSDMMGLVDGGYVYSTLFEYIDKGPKRYELILSMYPQENYRTLTNITMYMQDVPGSSAQAAKFLGERGINILNSISLDGISDTIIIWKMLVDLSFAGEMNILEERFRELKESDDPSVSLIDHISAKPADIGRVFHTEPAKEKIEVGRGAPVTLKNGRYDLSLEYGDILKGLDGNNVMIVADYASWLISVTFFKKETRLVKIGIDIPDCPGSITQVLNWIADKNINLISVFSKVKICYQTMMLDLVADFGNSKLSVEETEEAMRAAFEKMNGIYILTEYEELR